MKTLLLVLGSICIFVGLVQGLMFGLTEGPPISGLLGGILPTVAGVVGTAMICYGASADKPGQSNWP
jgi:hypothetical protein